MRRFLFLSSLVALIVFGVVHITRFYFFQTITPIRGEFITVEEQSLYITDHGEGLPVVFLHGFIFHSDTFFEIVKNPPSGYRYITIDWPGMGLSKKVGKKEMTPADLALLLKLVLDKKEISKVVIVGHDFGGGVGMVCAARYPGLVKGLVLISPDSSHAEAAAIMGEWWSWPVINKLWATIRLDRNFVRWYIRQCWAEDNQDWTKYVERFYQPLLFQNARKNLLQIHKARKSFHYLPYEERVEINTKIIWGAKDRVTPVKYGHELATALPRAKIDVIDNAGHIPHAEQVDKVIQIITDYVRTVDYSETKEK